MCFEPMTCLRVSIVDTLVALHHIQCPFSDCVTSCQAKQYRVVPLFHKIFPFFPPSMALTAHLYVFWIHDLRILCMEMFAHCCQLKGCSAGSVYWMASLPGQPVMSVVCDSKFPLTPPRLVKVCTSTHLPYPAVQWTAEIQIVFSSSLLTWLLQMNYYLQSFLCYYCNIIDLVVVVNVVYYHYSQ